LPIEPAATVKLFPSVNLAANMLTLNPPAPFAHTTVADELPSEVHASPPPVTAIGAAQAICTDRLASAAVKKIFRNDFILFPLVETCT